MLEKRKQQGKRRIEGGYHRARKEIPCCWSLGVTNVIGSASRPS
jgi:hypothetical protein